MKAREVLSKKKKPINLDYHHAKEIARKKADAFNYGWASGDDFISSKTDKGRLHTTLHKNKVKHEWEKR